MIDTIFETEFYELVVGDSENFQPSCKMYLVRNKQTGVIECEDSMLPRALDYTNQLTEYLQNFYKENNKTKFTLVEN